MHRLWWVVGMCAFAGVVLAVGCASTREAPAMAAVTPGEDDASQAPFDEGAEGGAPPASVSGGPRDASDPALAAGTWEVLTRSGLLKFDGVATSKSRFSGLAVDPNEDPRFFTSVVAQVGAGAAVVCVWVRRSP